MPPFNWVPTDASEPAHESPGLLIITPAQDGPRHGLPFFDFKMMSYCGVPGPFPRCRQEFADEPNTCRE